MWDDVYRVNVILACGGTINDLNKWIEKHPGYGLPFTEPVGNIRGRSLRGDGGSLLWIADPEDLVSLHHETIHLVMFIFRVSGVHTDEDNHEHLCYHSELWFERFLKKLKIGGKK